MPLDVYETAGIAYTIVSTEHCHCFEGVCIMGWCEGQVASGPRGPGGVFDSGLPYPNFSTVEIGSRMLAKQGLTFPVKAASISRN